MSEEEIKLDNKMKTIITNDWLREFPSYKKLRPQVLEKLVGPISFGIGYEVCHSVNMRVAFSIFNLTNPLEFMCATLMIWPKEKYFISWQQHEAGEYKEAAKELCQLSKIPIEGPVYLSQVIHAYKEYQNRPSSLPTNRNYEDPALIAAWAGKHDLAMECLEWGKSYYDKHYGSGSDRDPPTDIWYEKMLQKINDPEGLRKTVEDQIVFHKLTKLPREELIID